LEGVIEYEAYLQELAASTEDHMEGLRAFFRKKACIQREITIP
jgi:cytochrome c peroxidase